MMGRFITKEEQTYSKLFRGHYLKADYFYVEKYEKEFKAMLTKAIKRNSPVTIEELYTYIGGEEKYHLFIKQDREYYKSCGDTSPL